MRLGVIDFSEKHANIGTLFWATVLRIWNTLLVGFTNCSNHSSLVLFTIYHTVHRHCHCIPLSFPSSCAPQTSGLALRSLPRLSSALSPLALDFLPIPPLPWVLGAKYLASPLPFDGPGQVCLTPLVLPAILLSLHHESILRHVHKKHLGCKCPL